jgi:Alpha-glucuronidase
MKQLFFLILILFSLGSAGQEKSGFKINEIKRISIDPGIINDAAIKASVQDLAEGLGFSLTIGKAANSVKHPSLIIVPASSSLTGMKNKAASLPEEAFSLTKKTINHVPVMVVTGGSLRGICYGIYFVREQFKLQNYTVFAGDHLLKVPDFSFRMITQPFEAIGFKPVSSLVKPAIQERQFDPMRPFDGAGYSAEDEARNILRSGLNTMYIGSYTFATTYRHFSGEVFPDGSEGRKWVDERRRRFKELIAAAEKYHLNVCVNSDVFAYPKSIKAVDKWKALAASLDEILTDFPDIDYVIGRFGENYTYFNPFFTGEGPGGIDEMARTIDFISDIVVNKYHKIFIPRTWSLKNNSVHADPDLYLQLTNKIKAQENTFFSIKNTQTDFWRYNKFNPSFGAGTKKQAIEYLCQDGYHFKSSVPYYEVIRMAKGSKEADSTETGMKRAKEMGIEHTWGWLTADGWCGPYLVREEWLKANIYGYTRLMWNVDEDPAQLAKRWAALEFGLPYDSKASKNIADILMMSEDMIIKACYFEDFSRKHSGWLPASNWERDDVLGGGEVSHKNEACIHSNRPGILKPIFNPTTVEADCKEKQDALAIAGQMLLKYDEIISAIPDRKQAEEVRNTLLANKHLIATINFYINGMFRYYNREYDKAEWNLEQWQSSWANYTKVSSFPGAPTQMVNGGMVETVTAVLKNLKEEKSK